MIPDLIPPQAKVYLIGGAVIGALLFGAVTTWKIRSVIADNDHLVMQAAIDKLHSDAQAKVLEFSEQARQLEQAQADKSNAIAQAAELAKQKQQVITKTIAKEVIRYVENPSIVHVMLPRQWVFLHDSAALGRDPDMPEASDTTPKPDDPPATATDTQALATVTSNYATCRSNADQLVALQEWVRAIR